MTDKFKREVRKRMEQTGESYTAARLALLVQKDPDRKKKDAEAKKQIEELKKLPRRLADYHLHAINYGKVNHEKFREVLIASGYAFADWDTMKEEMQVAFIEAADAVMDTFAAATLA